MPAFSTSDATTDGDSALTSPPSSPRWDSNSSSRSSSYRLRKPYAVVPRKERVKKSLERSSVVNRAGGPIVVCGITLTPTVVFDTFWRFAAERQAVDDRRRDGRTRPWTDDPILQEYHFCNTFRVLDRLSQYIIREVIEKGSQKLDEIAFRVILFNLYTRIETWEMLQKEVGPLKWSTYSRDKYAAVLHKAKSLGKTLYTGAFQKPAPKFENTEGYVNHLILLEIFMDNEIHNKCLHAWHMADIYEYLISFPSMGEFATYQLMLNLSYSKLLNFHRNDFVVPGPGASSGLAKMFGKSISAGNATVRNFEVEVIRWLTDNQKDHFERLGLKPPGLGPQKLPMDVADVEHTLCELDKYARLAHSNIKGKRTEMRRSFEPKGSLPARPVLPKAWKHPARRKPRVRSDKVLVVEKRYSVGQIKDHREGADGREFLVYWYGYPASDATWEPERTLTDDAAGAVRDYLKKKNLTV